MKNWYSILLALSCSLPLASSAQTVCGELSADGKVLVVFAEGKTDTFYAETPPSDFPFGNFSSSGGTITSENPSVVSRSTSDTVYIDRIVHAAAPEPIGVVYTAEQLAQLLKEAKQEKKELEKQAKLDAKLAAKEARLAEKKLRKGEKADSVTRDGSLLADGLSAAGTGIAVGLTVAVGAVGIAAVGVGIAVIETGKFLARPFKKCDCEGTSSGKAEDSTADAEKGNASPEGKVLHRHGRRVKGQKRVRKSKTKIKDGPKCGKVSG